MGTDSNTYQDEFLPLFYDLKDENEYPNVKPLLSHYCSVATLEKVLTTDEIWFSNPLLMNDLQEVRFGIIEGVRLAFLNKKIAEACETEERAKILLSGLEHFATEFEDQQVLDVYILCFCEHKADDDDGKLSMWRGYGASGGGIALVLDSSKFNPEYQRLVLARVHYATDTERREWLEQRYEIFANLLKTNIPTDRLWIASHWLFERIKLFAIFSKHRGFSEEEEWRAAYLPWWDDDKQLGEHFGYAVTASGVHPKLKLPISKIPMLDGTQCALEKITDRIILGPTISYPLAKAGIERMLDLLKRPQLKPLIRACGIPFRPT